MKVIKGNALNFIHDDNEINVLVHQVNCQGVMGSGIAAQIAKEFPNHLDDYYLHLKIFKKHKFNVFGTSILSYAGDTKEKFICGLFSQFDCSGYKRETNYHAFSMALTMMMETFKDVNLVKPIEKIAMPYLIGCGLGGGDWTIVSSIIEDFEKFYNVEVILYEYAGG